MAGPDAMSAGARAGPPRDLDPARRRGGRFPAGIVGRAGLPLPPGRPIPICMSKSKLRSPAGEIAVIGEVDDWEEDVVKALLEIPSGGECVFFIDSAGGCV